MTGPMTDKTREQIRAIFFEAYKKTTPQERPQYLDEACGVDTELRVEIESLLEAHGKVGDFLESPVLGQGIILDDPPVAEGPGTVIGRYKLLEKIGEGGMAVVYMAEQQEPIRRKVALKIIKLGMDTRQVIARFEAERQALAMMDHPSIAKVLDAGSTETGRPYFVMELVQGVSITEYCDRNNVSTKDRLALFVQVCNAVQHAHQKGIIHRDIKPSNVMVTHHDGRPVPKVIDFGIAKATDQKLTEKTLFTRYAHIIGTPAYMSPEQAELSDLDIDTRSDIYSLGVLLYELLIGTTPFSEEELRKAGYIEMQRIIREKEPTKPSTKLSTLGDTLADIAKCRSSTPDLLHRSIRGDLDWIVMKSLEKDRARRYETASGLAEDIHRHLESEPILARSPGTLYRLHKFLRRNRSRVLGGIAGTLAMAVAVVVLSLWNRDRLHLAAVKELRDSGVHGSILSQAREHYAKGDREAASKALDPILHSKYFGPDARLLQARILVDNRRFDVAVTILNGLLGERPEIAGAAHSLLARILWESQSSKADKLAEIQEHRRQAEALQPKTAQAYYLQAMTALTVKKQLASLDEALDLDPKHYESRQLRAYTYYASRKYDQMEHDAFAMTILRRDPLAYSLHAIALRELGYYVEALAEYDHALAIPANDSMDRGDLSVQRCETLLRMASYERVIANAQEYLKLWPDKLVFKYQVFAALTAIGDYDKASALFQEIIGPGEEARRLFTNWCMKYVFDTLEAGRRWHAPDREPAGATFLPMIEAEETYRTLSAKGRRLLTDSSGGQWSPDGKKLAFSLGMPGYNGVAIFDPATKQTDLLIVPGKDPRWSPDGKQIAFVRYCDILRLDELVTALRADHDRPLQDEEVWIMNADGTGPQRLARGGWPSWSQDSTEIYYHSRRDKALCSISVAGGDGKAGRIMSCSNSFPSVSPDSQYVAYMDRQVLTVKDLSSQTLAAQWPIPFLTWGGAAWSPDNKELCVGGNGSPENRSGLWIYPLDGRELRKTLSGQITGGSWAPDGRSIHFDLGTPYFEAWTADLDPSMSTVDALGPAQTADEHFQEMVALHTRRIKAEPANANNYLQRAVQHHYLGDDAQSLADMKAYRTVLYQGHARESGLWSSAAFKHTLNGLFNRRIVFSAERPISQNQVLSIAFGQKGRCKMKLFEIPMVVTSLVGLGFLAGLDVPAAHADFTVGQAVNLGRTINGHGTAGAPCLSADGLELYGQSGDPSDMWVARRASPDAEWGLPSGLGAAFDTPGYDGGPCLSIDGLQLYFFSERTGGFGSMDIWVASRATTHDNWGVPVNVGAPVNTVSDELGVSITADGLELYFNSDRPGGYGNMDIWVTTRPTVNDGWAAPVNLGSPLNGSDFEIWPGISPDGLVLFFSSAFRAGGLGHYDLYMTRRTSRQDPWGPPVNLGPTVNSTTFEVGAKVSPDGSKLLFHSGRPGGFGSYDIWQAPIQPTVDFNGDTKVDLGDMTILESNLGKNQPLCDIGPFPWGDGVVNEKDLAVLMQSLMTPSPHASGVAPSAVLSWVTPSFAESFDVYLGTSRDAVTNADRADPCGVLVSQGQMGTTYDPNGLLEYDHTYYWRVDLVISGAAPTIYKGPVLSFSTEAFAYPIKNVAATASSKSNILTGPEKTIGGSGLDALDQHSTSSSQMWLSKKSQTPVWIQYDFDQVYSLHQMWVWNFNQLGEPDNGFGAKDVTIEVSTDGASWTALGGVTEFAQATGEPNYVYNTTVDFGGVLAKYIRLNIQSNWGDAKSSGLSEVRFFYIPDRSATKP